MAEGLCLIREPIAMLLLLLLCADDTARQPEAIEALAAHQPPMHAQMHPWACTHALQSMQHWCNAQRLDEK